MPGPILHTGAAATCPHGGSLQIMAASPRVMVGGLPVAVLTDQGMVGGCPFQIPLPPAGTKPQPCITTRWIVGAMRVQVGGQPVLINPSVALCLSAEQIPGGPPVISSSQTRVIAT
jgi:uncharacterized Zn-binding protein involved in type VI secretion